MSLEQVKSEVTGAANAFKTEITTTVPVTFNLELTKTVRIVALVVALFLTYSVVPHWFSYLSVSGTQFTGIFSPFTGALSAVGSRMLELLVIKSLLTVVAYMVAFPTHTILKFQARFSKQTTDE